MRIAIKLGALWDRGADRDRTPGLHPHVEKRADQPLLSSHCSPLFPLSKTRKHGAQQSLSYCISTTSRHDETVLLATLAVRGSGRSGDHSPTGIGRVWSRRNMDAD